MTEIERIAILETEVRTLKEGQVEIIEKLNDLLSLKNKGLGAFWLASALVGAVFMLISNTVLGWFKG